MKAVFFILTKVELLDKLLKELSEKGVKGGTILESNGMARELLAHDEESIFGSLRALLNPDYTTTKTLMFVIKDENVHLIVEAIEDVVGDLNIQDTGIVFSLPVDFIKGLKL